MLRFLADENFNNDIVRAARRKDPGVYILRVQDTPLRGVDDQALLEWAAANGHILLTHDVTTMTAYAYERLVRKQPMPGIIAVPRGVPVREAAEDIVLLSGCSLAGEWEGHVIYLPLR